MGINIMEMIRGRRQARAAGIEELARRLAAGEAVAPEDIEATLEQTGTDAELLQAAVDRLDRRAELLAAVARGNTAEGRIEKIEADIRKAADVVADAQRKHSAVAARYADELLELRRDVNAASNASNALLDPVNLSAADATRLAEARQAVSDAAEAAAQVRRSLPELRMSLEQADRVYADATDQARLNRGNADLQAYKGRAENTVKARRARLAAAEAELPRLQAAADAAEAAMRGVEDDLRR